MSEQEPWLDEPTREPEPVVLVVDDDASVRDSLRRLFTSEGLAVRAYPSAHAFLAARPGTGPTCLVLDVHLPDLSGLDLQARLAGTDTPPPIVFLAGRGDIPMTVKAIKAGAVEFLTKPYRPEELVAAVRHGLAQDGAQRQDRRERLVITQRYQSLTAREQGVMAGVVRGLLNKQIASEFGTKEATVKEQRAQMMRKMVAGSLPELVRMASRLGLPAVHRPSLPRG